MLDQKDIQFWDKLYADLYVAIKKDISQGFSGLSDSLRESKTEEVTIKNLPSIDLSETNRLLQELKDEMSKPTTITLKLT